MKAVILAGGSGTRLSEETDVKPKPMVEIGGHPILWHIMQIFSAYGIKDFVICLGYKGYVIKEYFANYFIHNSDVTFDLGNNTVHTLRKNKDDWRVTLVDTGIDTMTGGRLKRIKPFVDDTFCMTYGDGVADVDMDALIATHRKYKKLATVSAVVPPGRFGVLDIKGHSVKSIREKPNDEIGSINGGFFVLEPEALKYIKDDADIWEREPMEQLAAHDQLVCYHHNGFWQPMDTLRDKRLLEDLCREGKAPWMKRMRNA
jgi:glucose-1-phosphate cytidylyltransferase